MDLYSIGEMVIDFLPGEGEGVYIRNAGGAPANVAIAAARNGLDSGMCCKVGEDDFGRFLFETLRKEKVRVMCPERCGEAVTTMAFVSLDDEGERSFTFARKPGADMFLRPEEVRESDIRQAAVIHAGSCSLSAGPAAEATRKALRLGHENGKIVSFDINYRDLMWEKDRGKCAEAVREILPCVDLLKLSDEEADLIGGEARLPELIREARLTAVILTCGGEGARAYFQDQILSVKGRKVRAVDTTGAGDAFWGGFLSSLLLQGVRNDKAVTEETLRVALDYGTVSGALCVQKKGAIASLPGREEIEQTLRGDRV